MLTVCVLILSYDKSYIWKCSFSRTWFYFTSCRQEAPQSHSKYVQLRLLLFTGKHNCTHYHTHTHTISHTHYHTHTHTQSDREIANTQECMHPLRRQGSAHCDHTMSYLIIKLISSSNYTLTAERLTEWIKKRRTERGTDPILWTSADWHIDRTTLSSEWVCMMGLLRNSY